MPLNTEWGLITIGVILIVFSVSYICAFEAKTSHEFRVHFYKNYRIKSLQSPQIIEGEILIKILFLAGIIFVLSGYIVLLLFLDILFLLGFNFKIAVFLILPVIIGVITCIFLINQCFIKIYIFQDKLMVKKLISKKIIYFSELDYLEFVQQCRDLCYINRYIFKKKGVTILKLKTRAFKNLQIIEKIFNPENFDVNHSLS